MPKDTSQSPQASKKSGRFAFLLLVLAGVVVILTIYVGTTGPRGQEEGSVGASRSTLSEQVIRKAQPLLDARQYARAVSLMQTYLRQNVDDVEVRVLLGDALMRLGRNAEAERTIDDVLRRAPQMSRALWTKGELVRRRGEKNAMHFFRLSAQSGDASVEIWAKYGQELLDAGKVEAAREYLDRARKGGLNDARTLGPLGELAVEEQRFEEAEELLREALRTAWDNPRVWAMLARAQKNNAKGALAAETLTDALTACPKEFAPGLYIELGEVLWTLQRGEDAAQAYATAAQFPSPLQAEGWYRAGRCYYHLGRYDEAIRCVDKAGAIETNSERLDSLREKIKEFAPDAVTTEGT